MRISRINVNSWKDAIKEGDMVATYAYMEPQRYHRVLKSNFKNIWVGPQNEDIGIIEWKDVTDVFTPEADPEYFL